MNLEAKCHCGTKFTIREWIVESPRDDGLLFTCVPFDDTHCFRCDNCGSDLEFLADLWVAFKPKPTSFSLMTQQLLAEIGVD